MEPKNLRRIPIILLSGLGIWLIGAASLIASGSKERVEPAEVAVVLGNQVYPNGEPSPQLKVRLDRVFELYHQRSDGDWALRLGTPVASTQSSGWVRH